VSLLIHASRVAVLPEALDYARAGFLPGGLGRNVEFISGCVEFADGISEQMRNLLYDPQTSGGLLLSVGAGDAARLAAALKQTGIPAEEIGEVIAKTHPLLRVE
jgi:selenide,water dikinase